MKASGQFQIAVLHPVQPAADLIDGGSQYGRKDKGNPWLTKPPHPFSRKLMTAKPTICAQQPTTAAPPARPVSPSTEQILHPLTGEAYLFRALLQQAAPAARQTAVVRK